MIRFAPIFSLIGLLVLSPGLGRCQSVTLPYNPDSEPDGIIGAVDVVESLSIYGQNFTPGEILVDGETLGSVISGLTSTIDSLNQVVNTLNADLMSLQTLLSSEVQYLQNEIYWLQSEISALPAMMLETAVNKNPSGILPPGSMPPGDWTAANLEDQLFPGPSFQYSVFDHAYLGGASLNTSSFQLFNMDYSYTSFHGARFYYTDVTNCNFTGADFSEADLEGVNLTTCTLTDATMNCLVTCPSGLPSGYVCTSDPTCHLSGRFHVYQP